MQNLIFIECSITWCGPNLLLLIINGLNSVASDSDGLVDNETLGGAGSFTLDGAQTSSGSATNLKSTVSIKSSSNNASVTFTITGKDLNGNDQIETITGVNANTIEGTKFFKDYKKSMLRKNLSFAHIIEKKFLHNIFLNFYITYIFGNVIVWKRFFTVGAVKRQNICYVKTQKKYIM